MATESLESCVQKLDLRTVPQVLDQVSDVGENETPRHFSISVYAELARMHKQAVIPYIPRMMASIVRSLPFSSDSQQLHEACSKVVASVARYTVDPTRPHDSNQQIIFNLCSPFLPPLSSKLNSCATGAAICLQALVESEKWKFAHPDLQDLVCAKVTAALVEQGTDVVTSFLHLARSLVKFSMDAAKGHVAEWLGVGLHALQADSASWQRRLAAAQLLTAILKTAYADESGIDLSLITKRLETCLLDKVSVVQIAVREALEATKDLVLGRHMFCAENYGHCMPGQAGSANSSCGSRGRASDAEEPGMQDVSNSVSPRSGTSSHESVPSMTSSKAKFATEPKQSKQRENNASVLSHLSGSLTRTSMLKENTPATIPRRVLSEIPTSGKRLSSSDFLASTGEAKSLRRSSVDIGSKTATYSLQNWASFGSKKDGEYVQSSIHDVATRTASLTKKHSNEYQNGSNTEWTHFSDLGKNESNPCENITGRQGKINGKEDFNSYEVLDDRSKNRPKELPGGFLSTSRCFPSDCIACESDGGAGCTDCARISKDVSMEVTSKDMSAPGKGSFLKVADSHSPLQDFTFRAPGSLMHSIQQKVSTKDMRQSYKDHSDCTNRALRGACWTTSGSLASGDSEEDQSAPGKFQSGNAPAISSCCRSEESDTCVVRTSSHSKQQNFQSTSESVCRLSSRPPNGSDISASKQDWLSSSRDNSDRGESHNAKVGHLHVNNDMHKTGKKSGYQRRPARRAQGHHDLSAGLDVKSREVKHLIGISEIHKGEVCAGAALGVLCAVGMLILAVLVIQHVNWSYGLHVLVPT